MGNPRPARLLGVWRKKISIQKYASGVPWEQAAANLFRREIHRAFASPKPCHPEDRVLCGPKACPELVEGDLCNLPAALMLPASCTGPSAGKGRPPQDDKHLFSREEWPTTNDRRPTTASLSSGCPGAALSPGIPRGAGAGPLPRQSSPSDAALPCNRTRSSDNSCPRAHSEAADR